MARDRETPDISKSSLEKAVSSDDLLKQAWESMGRTETGDRLGDDSTSRSAEMTSAANLSSISTTEERASAEEIARLLRAEAEGRRADVSASRQSQREPVRTPPPPQRRDSPARRRPRRTEPLPPPTSTPGPTVPVPDAGRSRQTRRGIIWAVVGAIWAIGAVIGSFADSASTDEPGVTVEVTAAPAEITTTLPPDIDPATVVQLGIRDLQPGTCIATFPSENIVDSVATVPCAQPHQYELFANAELTGDGDYPGNEIFDMAFESCAGRFFDYVGEAYATSDWYVDVITPTEEGWNRGNDRTVNCVLYLWDETAEVVQFVTGSAAGSGA